MGTGRASGENRACEAMEKAISSSLLEDVNIQGARALLINVTGNESVGLHEVDEAVSTISEMVDEDANIIFGIVNDPDMGEELSITVVATGLNHKGLPDPVFEPTVEKAIVEEKIIEIPAPVETQIPRAKDYAKFEVSKSSRVAVKPSTSVAYDEEQLSIPTWIRKQAD